MCSFMSDVHVFTVGSVNGTVVRVLTNRIGYWVWVWVGIFPPNRVWVGIAKNIG